MDTRSTATQGRASRGNRKHRNADGDSAASACRAMPNAPNKPNWSRGGAPNKANLGPFGPVASEPWLVARETRNKPNFCVFGLETRVWVRKTNPISPDSGRIREMQDTPTNQRVGTKPNAPNKPNWSRGRAPNKANLGPFGPAASEPWLAARETPNKPNFCVFGPRTRVGLEKQSQLGPVAAVAGQRRLLSSRPEDRRRVGPERRDLLWSAHRDEDCGIISEDQNTQMRTGEPRQFGTRIHSERDLSTPLRFGRDDNVRSEGFSDYQDDGIAWGECSEYGGCRQWCYLEGQSYGR